MINSANSPDDSIQIPLRVCLLAVGASILIGIWSATAAQAKSTEQVRLLDEFGQPIRADFDALGDWKNQSALNNQTDRGGVSHGADTNNSVWSHAMVESLPSCDRCGKLHCVMKG